MIIPVVSEIVSTPVMVPTIKAHLSIDHNLDDPMLNLYANSALHHAMNECNREFRKVGYSLRAPVKPADDIVLRPLPVISVESVTDVPADQYTVYLDEFECRLSPINEWPVDEITVNFTSGYDELPVPVLQWLLLRVAAMYLNPSGIVTGTGVRELPPSYVDNLLDEYRVVGDI